MNAIIFGDALTKSLNDNVAAKDLIERNNEKLTIKRQCELVGLARSSCYRQTVKKPMFTDEEEEAMKIIDKTHIKHPTFGARSHMVNLTRYKIFFSRRRVKKLMDHIHVCSTAPQPRLSVPNKKAKCAPYLLRGLSITHPNQVWSTDITYIPLGRGHVYLSAIIDWYSRYIVGWRLHETLEAHECVLCTNKAFEDYGTPAIGNSDQGSTYTSKEYCECLRAHGVRQSMDGYRRWADNILIERWFRSLKHEQIYQTEYSSLKELKHLITEYVDFYNNERAHSALDYQTPAEWYFSGINSRSLYNAKCEHLTESNKCYYKEAA